MVLKAPPSTVGWGSLLLTPNRDCQTSSPTKALGTSDTNVMPAPDSHIFPRQTQRLLIQLQELSGTSQGLWRHWDDGVSP